MDNEVPDAVGNVEFVATSVATVSAGLVTSVNYGTTTITASYGGPKATAALTVQSPALVSITISPTTYTIALKMPDALTGFSVQGKHAVGKQIVA